MNWLGGLKAKVLVGEPLTKHTTIKVGPKAELWIEPLDKEDLMALIKKARSLKTPKNLTLKLPITQNFAKEYWQ